MNFRVAWDRRALRELADVYLNARDRKAVALAANVIERMLMLDPHNEGKPRGRKFRRLFVTPITVEYRIDDRNRLVTIFRVEDGDQTA
jgi:mRNA-degrading endonuclease RelE of RelBE toxin-antitoxin system